MSIIDLEENSVSAPQEPRNKKSTNDSQDGVTIEKQSQHNYLSYKTMDVHDFLTDCLNGTGVCACSVKDGNKSAITPNKSELQYEDRVEKSERFNFVKKHVHAQVKPIFVDSNIESVIEKNGSEISVDTQGFAYFLKGYDKFLSQCCIWGTLNDVVYIIMDKKPNGDISRVYRNAVSVLFPPLADDNGNLEWIMFYDGKYLDKEAIKKGREEYILKATSYEMIDGVCHKQKWEAPYTEAWRTKTEAWRMIDEPINTGSERMLVGIFVVGDHPEGTLLPSSAGTYEIARLDMLVMNMLSTMLWTHSMHGHPLLTIFGKIAGLNLNVGSILNQPTNSEMQAPPPPSLLERNPDSLRVSMEFLEMVISQLHQAMKQYGVALTPSNTAQAQTAESKAFDYQANNQSLRNTVKELCEPIDNWVLSMYMYLKTGSVDDWSITRSYPQDFFPDVKETVDELLEIEDRAMSRGLTGVLEETWTKIVDMISPNASLDRKQELRDSIEAVISTLKVDDTEQGE